LEAGETGAEAVARALAEGQMRVRAAGDVEPVGVGEDGRIAVGGRVQQQDRLTGFDGDLADRDIGVGVAELPEPGAHRDEPEEFLDRVGDQ
jgi:hypothetical protein